MTLFNKIDIIYFYFFYIAFYLNNYNKAITKYRVLINYTMQIIQYIKIKTLIHDKIQKHKLKVSKKINIYGK